MQFGNDTNGLFVNNENENINDSESDNSLRLRILEGIREMRIEDFRLTFIEKLFYQNQYWRAKKIKSNNSEEEMKKWYVFRIIEKLELFKVV